jgi:hypothetical protein
MNCAASVVLIWFLAAPQAEKEAKLQESLENSVRAFYKGMRSGNEEEQLKALRYTSPTKKDFEALFGSYSDKLWAMVEPNLKAMEKQLPDLVKECEGGGEIQKVETDDLRKKNSGEYARVFKLIPGDVPVYETIVRMENRLSGGAVYVRVNDRWLLFTGLSAVPRMIDKMK